jgi:hypothetical protein
VKVEASLSKLHNKPSLQIGKTKVKVEVTAHNTPKYPRRPGPNSKAYKLQTVTDAVRIQIW